MVMELLAHNGVDHSTAAEAANHSANSAVITTIVITAVVVAVAAGAIYLVNRFALKKVPVKDKEEE